MVVQSDEAYQA